MRKEKGTQTKKRCILALLGLAMLGLVGGLTSRGSASSGARFHSLPKQRTLAPVKAYDFSSLVKKIKPAVFNISTRGMRSTAARSWRSERLFRFFGTLPFELPRRWQPRQLPIRSNGSGFVFHEQGYALTNAHVVRGAQKIRARFADGRSYPVEVVGSSRLLDLALLRLKARPGVRFPYAYVGRSSKLEVGEPVIAIGNARGLGLTVTAGIVSAKGRVIGSGPYDDYIQTDAAINHGNSGGPLFNRRGEVIGINTAILRGGRGIGFAIPIDMVRQVLPQLRSKGTVERARMGVVVQKVSPRLARSFGLSSAHGALVSRVSKGSGAHKAGLKVGDVIVEVQGQRVRDHRHLTLLVAFRQPGKAISVLALRNKQKKRFKVLLQRWGDGEDDGPVVSSLPSTDGLELPRLGVKAAPVEASLRRRWKIPPKQGVRIAAVDPGSPAQLAGIRKGDVLLSMNRKPISSPQQLKQRLSGLASDEPVLLRLMRRDAAMFVVVNLP